MFTIEDKENTVALIRSIIEEEYTTEWLTTIICFHKDQSEEISEIIYNKWDYKAEIKMLSNNNQDVSCIIISYDCESKMLSPTTNELEIELTINHIPMVIVTSLSDSFLYRSHIYGIKRKNWSKSIYRPDLKFIPKSAWEANIARILNHLAIPYEYEKNSFERFDPNTKEHIGYYFPDFFLPNETILEVKGFWNPQSRSKVYEFSKYYCNENNHFTELHEARAIYKLYIIDCDIYYTLSKMYRGLITDWEEDRLPLSYKEILQVVGLSFGKRRITVSTLEIGQEVILKRDMDNKYDSNAILVFTYDMREIGFVSADWACIYSPKMNIGMNYRAHIISIETKVISIEVTRENVDEIVMFDWLVPK